MFSVLRKKGIDVMRIKEKNNQVTLRDLLILCAKKNIQSILVEGGRQIYDSFLQEKLVNEIYIFKSKKKFGAKGLDAVSNIKYLKLTERNGIKTKFGPDIFIHKVIKE